MVEIEFSYILDLEHDKRTWAAFMDEFTSKHGVKVHIRHEMTWDTAWTKLFSYASQGKGPHVSHIGSSWINNLARLNVLRPFKPNEITSIGGSWDFVTPNWESGILSENKHVWAIPWTTWMYVICYRKDLLEQVGIDPAGAFGTINAVAQTVERLTVSPLEMPWLNSQRPVSNRNFLHIAASWVWAAGGDFTNKEGTTVLFDSPQAIQGLKNWLDSYCAVRAPYKKLTQPEIVDMFREGRAAAVVADIHGANTFINAQTNPVVRKNLGVASIADIPWTGGGSFIVWEHVCRNPQQEQAAVELVKFLASKDIHLRYQREAASMPARIDALKETYPDGNPAREAVMLTTTKGRHYYNTPTWRRIEYELSKEIGAVVKATLNNPSANTEAILRAHLDPLARQLNLTLHGLGTQ
jgi:multiple sugar transport system substrate-binding protein